MDSVNSVAWLHTGKYTAAHTKKTQIKTYVRHFKEPTWISVENGGIQIKWRVHGEREKCAGRLESGGWRLQR